ncbi:MAG: ABC transporter ATP-binding protein [Anaerolineales bacterium]
MIVIEDLVKTYGLQPVLRNLNLEVERGQFLTLLGPNGSGKSTLLRILQALAKPTSGRVTVGGWDLPKEAFAVRRQMGVVSHLPLLYDTLTAEENLLFFAELYDLPADTRRDRVREVLEQVGLKFRARDTVSTFSRGMLQRLTIARAILHNPAVLLFDEPYTGLDQQAAEVLDELLMQLSQDTEHTIIMTTHDIQRGHRLASHLAILHRGKIAYQGPCSAIANQDIPSLYAQTVEAAR